MGKLTLMTQKRTVSEEVDWNTLYGSWRNTSQIWGLPDTGVAFTEILVPSPTDGLQIGEEIIDWWPTHDVARRRASLTKYGLAGAFWNTRTGTLHTAQLLYECRGAPEAQAAILAAASLWDKETNLPEEWRREISKLVDETRGIVLNSSESPFKQRELIVWHHAMRDALPVSVVNFDFAKCLQPRSPSQLLRVTMIEAALSTSLWTLVIVSHDAKGVRLL